MRISIGPIIEKKNENGCVFFFQTIYEVFVASHYCTGFTRFYFFIFSSFIKIYDMHVRIYIYHCTTRRMYYMGDLMSLFFDGGFYNWVIDAAYRTWHMGSPPSYFNFWFCERDDVMQCSCATGGLHECFGGDVVSGITSHKFIANTFIHYSQILRSAEGQTRINIYKKKTSNQNIGCISTYNFLLLDHINSTNDAVNR